MWMFGSRTTVKKVRNSLTWFSQHTHSKKRYVMPSLRLSLPLWVLSVFSKSSSTLLMLAWPCFFPCQLTTIEVGPGWDFSSLLFLLLLLELPCIRVNKLEQLLKGSSGVFRVGEVVCLPNLHRICIFFQNMRGGRFTKVCGKAAVRLNIEDFLLYGWSRGGEVGGRCWS